MIPIKEYILEERQKQELSEILKNISKNEFFIKLLQDNDYEYTLKKFPSRDDLINGLCDYVCYFIYNQYNNKYKYYCLTNGWDVHWIIFDPFDKLYKDGYDYKGKSKYQNLHWYKQLNDKKNFKLEEMIPEPLPLSIGR